MKYLIACFALMGLILTAAALTQPDAAAPQGVYPPGREPMTLPRDYRERFIHYATVDRIDGISRSLYISPELFEAIVAGEDFPERGQIVIEAFVAQRDLSGRILVDADGHFIQDERDPEIHVMEHRTTWRIEDLPGSTHMGGWNFGAFDYATGAANRDNLNDCASCHDAAFSRQFVFTLPRLLTFARTGEVQHSYCPLPERIICR